MKDFLWGVSTSSAQVEGGWDQDGKGETIWDYYSKVGACYNKNSCLIACDSYNRVDEDIALMKELGINSYRFSLAWARLIPDGEGEVNQKGVDFYSRYIDKLLEAGIEPFMTVYHWDLPLALYKKGGFSNRKIVDWMEKYARVVGKAYGDRVKYFSMFNEPECLTDFTYLHPIIDGVEEVQSLQTTFEAMHNILLCNGVGTRALKETVRKDAVFGVANATDICMPKTDKDIEAARQLMWAPRKGFLFDHVGFLDPIFFGKYNEAFLKEFKLDTSFIKQGEMEIIHCPLDFIGLNIYTGNTVEFDENGKAVYSTIGPNAEYSSNLRRFTPNAMYYGPKFIQERYNRPIYITENGVALSDTLDEDGGVTDNGRIKYLKTYVEELLRAKKDGVDIRGYFHWSFLDNFEWKSGYWPRFGLVHTDFETLKRTPKKSFYSYRDLIKEKQK